MNTVLNSQDVIVMLNSLSNMRGPQLATFANKKWQGEVDLRDKDRDELKKLVNKSLSIDCSEGKLTRRSITGKWTLEVVELKRANKAKAGKRAAAFAPASFGALSSSAARRAKQRAAELEKVLRPKQRAKRAGKAEGRAAAKAKGATREGSQGSYITECILAGMSNKEVYEALLERFGAGTIGEKHKMHPAWYRWKMRKAGLIS